jgi:hypothetical protein
MTKKYRKRYIILLIISVFLNVYPILYYTASAFIESNAVVHKVTLCSTIFIVLILSMVSWVTKVSLRSSMWILTIGLYMCLDSLLDMIMMIAAFQIIDEMIISPLKKFTKHKFTINKELDKRL